MLREGEGTSVLSKDKRSSGVEAESVHERRCDGGNDLTVHMVPPERER